MKIIKFTKIRFVMFAISLLLIVSGLVVAFTKGPNWGIDFKNGLSMTITVKDYNSTEGVFEPAVNDTDTLLIEEIRGWFADLDTVPAVQLQSDENSRYSVRAVFAESEVSDEETAELVVDPAAAERAKLEAAVEATGVKVISAGQYEEGLAAGYEGRLVVIESSQSSSPTWTANSWNQLIVLLLVAMLLITIYIWIRFTWSYAMAAMTALVHDVLIMIGFLCIMPFEISKTTIAALLTIIGYSLNDTIVVFDRIRENRRLMIDAPIRTVINTSITQSLSRTIITSLTTFVAVAALFVLAEGEIKSFSANMMAGVVFGTYSSIFIASPVLLQLILGAEAFKRNRKMKKYGTSAGMKKNPAADAVVVDEQGEIEIPMIERKQRRKKK